MRKFLSSARKECARPSVSSSRISQNFGPWFASESEEEQKRILRENPDLVKVWDEKYGDRIIRLVFIGQHMDKKKIIAVLDDCLGE